MSSFILAGSTLAKSPDVDVIALEEGAEGARYKRPDFDMVDSRFPICGGVCRITLGKNLGACLASVVNRRADIVAASCAGNCGG